MKILPTFKEILNLTYKVSLGVTLFFTLLCSFVFVLIGLEISSFDRSNLFQLFENPRELWIVGLFLILIFIWGFISSTIGLYLFSTSFILSKKYGRFLVVLSGIFFLSGVFHLIPVSDINDSYSWFTNIYIRFIQGVLSVTFLLIPYGLIQGLTIYIIGRDDKSIDGDN